MWPKHVGLIIKDNQNSGQFQRSSQFNSSNKNSGPRVNEQIRIPECRLLGDDGHQYGVVSMSEARRISDEVGLDLVEGGLRFWRHVRGRGQQVAGFGDFGGAGFADFVQLHRGAFLMKCPCNRRAGCDSQRLSIEAYI